MPLESAGAATVSAGVSLVITLGKLLPVKLSVDLGCGELGMSQQLLHSAQVVAGFQQVGGK